MLSAYERAVAKASRAIDARHGKRLRFVPKPVMDNWGKAASGAGVQQPFDVIGGIIDGVAGFEFLAGDKRNSEFAAQTVNQQKSASIERYYFPAGKPGRGDHLQVLDDNLQPIEEFEIMASVNDGPSRFAMLLVAVPVTR